MTSYYNPVTFAPAALVAAFRQPGTTVQFTFIPPASQSWVELIVDPISQLVIQEAAKVGNIQAILSPNPQDLNRLPQAANLKLTNLKFNELYMVAIFNFFIKWNRPIHKTIKNNRDYLDFGPLNIIDLAGRPVGAYLPVDEDIFTWVAMPDYPINSIDQLLRFIDEIDDLTITCETVNTFIPPVTLRSDSKNQPPMENLMINLVTPTGQWSGPIKSAFYSNRFILNDQGAFVPTMAPTETISAICSPMAPTMPNEFIIDRPFVLAAGTKQVGIIFAVYIPLVYWNFTPGPGAQALQQLDLAAFGQYQPIPHLTTPRPRLVVSPPAAVIKPLVTSFSPQPVISPRPIFKPTISPIQPIIIQPPVSQLSLTTQQLSRMTISPPVAQARLTVQPGRLLHIDPHTERTFLVRSDFDLQQYPEIINQLENFGGTYVSRPRKGPSRLPGWRFSQSLYQTINNYINRVNANLIQ